AGGIDQSAELYDPTTGLSAPTGDMHAQRQRHTATELLDGTVLITGGQNFSGGTNNYLATAELYHPDTGAFELLVATMSTPRASATATLLSTGDVLIAGGWHCA